MSGGVNLKTANLFTSAENGGMSGEIEADVYVNINISGASAVVANRPTAAGWETFGLANLPGGPAAITANANGNVFLLYLFVSHSYSFFFSYGQYRAIYRLYQMHQMQEHIRFLLCSLLLQHRLFTAESRCTYG